MVNVGIVGATGAVGKEILECLKSLAIPIGELRLGASARSVGKTLDTPFGPYTLQDVNQPFFQGLDFVIFSAGSSISQSILPLAEKEGVTVIDNSSAFRYDDNIPLVIPQINGNQVKGSPLIANPNCTTAIAAVVIHPIYKKYGVKKIIMSTYQATSGAGAKGMEELEKNTQAYFDGTQPEVECFVENIAFNVIPHIDAFQENGYTKEEMKVVWETKKILGVQDIDISCTAVRIPTLRAHSETLVIETEREVDIQELKELLRHTPGVELVDDTKNNLYPMPKNASGKYDVEVGRIRHNLVFGKKSIELFISGDQLLRGAALNAVEILQECIGISAKATSRKK